MKGWCVVLVVALFFRLALFVLVGGVGGAGEPYRTLRRRSGARDRLLGARRLLSVAGAPAPSPLRPRANRTWAENQIDFSMNVTPFRIGHPRTLAERYLLSYTGPHSTRRVYC